MAKRQGSQRGTLVKNAATRVSSQGGGVGHIRVGRLPKTKPWNRVVALMGEPGVDPAQVASAIVAAAVDAYRNAGDDPGVIESLRAMAFLADASRRQDFAGSLSRFGYDLEGTADALGFLTSVFKETERRFGPMSERTVFTEFAYGALREALTETVASQTGSLFYTGVEEMRDAYRAFSTERGFARLTRLFFSRMLSRSLLYFSDHEAANQLGGTGLRSEADIHVFNEAVGRYAFEASGIVEEYAGDWYSKKRWLGTVQQTEGMAATAMHKIADELAMAE